MKPRIYLYKITFANQPEWYWGIHKEKKFGEEYWGSPCTHKNFWSLYEPIKEILSFYDYSQEGWTQALKEEKDLIRPDLNNPLCLNEACGGVISLEALSLAGWKNSTPERREKASRVLSELCEVRWQDPKYRELHSEKMRNQWKDPDFLEASKGNKRGTGTRWITNGTKEGSIKIKADQEIPEGYRLGRVCR